MKVYKQKIKYHNLQGDFPKGTQWIYNKQTDRYWLESYKTSTNIFLAKDFVENNSDIFELDPSELLLEANRKYPKGTKYISISPDTLYSKSIIKSNLYSVHLPSDRILENDGVMITDGFGGAVYYDGKWADIVKVPLFTTEDGVEIYERTPVWWYNTNWELWSTEDPDNSLRGRKTFSTEEKALEYIDLNKPKYSKQDIIDAITKSTVDFRDVTRPIVLKDRLESILKELN